MSSDPEEPLLTEWEATLAFEYFNCAFFGGMLKSWTCALETLDDGIAAVDPAQRTVTLDLEVIEDEGVNVFEVLTCAMARAYVCGIEDEGGGLYRNLLRRLYLAGAPVDSTDFGGRLDYEPAGLISDQ